MAACDQYAERLEAVRDAVFDIEDPISRLRGTAEALVDLAEMAKTGERMPSLRMLDLLANDTAELEREIHARFKDAHALVVQPPREEDSLDT